MKSKLWVAAALLLAACARSGAPSGGLEMGVNVNALGATANFCMTWKLFELVDAKWTVVDERSSPICAANGVDTLSDFATCTDGRRFLVEYGVTFGGTATGTAVATSGGTAADVCVKNADRNTTAYLQYAEQGSRGGVNPGAQIDQVCTNDKLVVEGDQIVSALWVQPESCSGNVPDDFCSFGSGVGFATARTGVTSDGLTRYIFNTGDAATAKFVLFYLAFDPGLAADTLYLYHSPWVLQHWSGESGLMRTVIPAAAAFRYNSSVGYITRVGSMGQAHFFYDTSAQCNGPIALAPTAEAGHFQTIQAPSCTYDTYATIAGVVPAGGSAFDIVLECPGGNFTFVRCDAMVAGVSPICLQAG